MRVRNEPAVRRTTLVTDETRRLILEAAETEFAERGFSGARLMDIAERVGITRAAVLYHFAGKQALYDAVLESAFEPLAQKIQAAVTRPASNAERIEGLVCAWFDYATERPALGRLFMREVAEAGHDLSPEVQRLGTPLFVALVEAIEQGQRDGEFRAIEAVHVANILCGATIWLTSGARLVERGAENDESRARRLAQHRDELVGVARHLLAIPPRARKKTALER